MEHPSGRQPTGRVDRRPSESDRSLEHRYPEYRHPAARDDTVAFGVREVSGS